MIPTGRLSPLDRRTTFSRPTLRAALVLILAPLLAHASFDKTSSLLTSWDPAPKISQKLSDNCAKKVKALEARAAQTNRRGRQSTRISEDELNSYLAFELKDKFHPSLKSLQISLRENGLSAKAEIDFDSLSMSATQTMTRMIARLFSGIHRLSVSGKLVTGAGMGSFELEEARFDNTPLPNILVSEIISAVGKKQKPPFDPMQPSQMLYAIDRVDIHAGNIIVYQ